MHEQVRSQVSPPPMSNNSRSELPEVPISPKDDTYAAAKAAAEEAKRTMMTEDSDQHRRTPGVGKSIMSSIFGKKPLPFFGESRHGSSNSSLPDSNDVAASEEQESSPSPLTSSTTLSEENDPVARLQREQEEAKRAVAERELAALRYAQEQAERRESQKQEQMEREVQYKMQQQQQQRMEEQRRYLEEKRQAEIRAVQEEELRRAEEERKRLEEEQNKSREPGYRFELLLGGFADSTIDALHRVTQLRNQRAILLEERAAAEKQHKLAAQQVKQAEAQQMVAAEQEDFDLAERLAGIIEKHASEKVGLDTKLKTIGEAISELDAKSAVVVQGVTQCFNEVKTKLITFKSEQSTVEEEDGTEAMERFAATSKHLSAENKRLIDELEHLEKHEGLVAEERKEVEGNISLETGDIEKTRNEAREKLDDVNSSIEELRKQLAEKEKESMDLLKEITIHETEISKIRTKFSRQLTRVNTKEQLVQTNRSEWEAEKAGFEKTKREHEAKMKAHSEALLARDEMMKNIDKEAADAERFACVVADEVVLDERNESCKHDSELLELQEEVVKCEAAVDETQQLVLASEAAVESLKNETEEIEAKIPILEAEKKLAAAKRDFRAAGKASKAIKEAAARKERLEEELAGEAVERVAAAKEDLQKLKDELETKRKVAHEKEKESGIRNMTMLAQKIMHLERIKKRVCGDCSNSDNKNSISSIGAIVLDQEINSLQTEGEALGAKFGRWESIKKEVNDKTDPGDDNVEDCGSEPETSPMNASENEEEEHKSDPIPNENDQDQDEGDDAPNVVQELDKENDSGENVDKDIAKKKFKDLTKRLKELEVKLEDAVEREDYDEAADLDQEFQDIKSQIESLGLSDSDIESLTEGEEDLGSEEDKANKEESESEDTLGEAADKNSAPDTESSKYELNGESNADVTVDEKKTDEADKQT